jgi:hypothetical protein
VGASSGGDHLHALRSDGYSYWLASPANISIWGLATRWLVPNGWVNGASLAVIGKVLAGFLALTIVALALRPPTGRTRDPFWAAVPLMLLAWPITWNQYLVLALPWVIIALTRAVEDRSRPMIVATVVVGALLMLGLPPGLTSIDRASDLQVALGYQVPTLALIGAMALEFVGGGARHFNNQRSGREP